MSAVLPRSRVSHEQLDVLLSFMEEHPEFAAGKQSIYSRFSASKLWRLLAERLNAAAADSGGARKSPDKWCRYWADIKYKARKKTAAGGALGELSHVEERLQAVLGAGGAPLAAPRDYGGRNSHSDEDRKPSLLDDETGSADEARDGGAGDGVDGGARLATEELLAEAAMRSALAAEKQAEAVAQGVELLRELLALMRREACAPPAPAPGPPLHVPDHHAHALQHAHHRL